MKRNFILVIFSLILFKAVVAIDSTVHTVMSWECPRAVVLHWEKPNEFEIATFRVIGRFVVRCFDQDDELPGFAKGLFLNEWVYERN